MALLVHSIFCFLLVDYGKSQSLGYSYFRFEPAPSNGYDSFTAIVNVLADPGTSCDGLFMSHQFFFKGGNGGYMGLQTHGSYDVPLKRNGVSQAYNYNLNRTDSPFANGKMAIFSIWDATNCETAEGKNTADMECVKGTESGPFYSIHFKLDWVVNKYSFKLSKSAQANWWMLHIFVNDDTSNGIYVGQIQVPSSWAGINGGYDAFLEKYTGTSGCNGHFPAYASFDYGQIFNGNVYPYNSSYTIGANGAKCKCVTANITKSNHYDVDYTIDKKLGGCN